MPTSRRLVQFSEGKTAPDGGLTVYIDGAFDMFHPGHVEILKVGAGLYMCNMCVCVGGGGMTDGVHVRAHALPAHTCGCMLLVTGCSFKHAGVSCNRVRARCLAAQAPAAAPAHVSHPAALLQAAKAQGDFLLVGLHSDEDVAKRRG